MTPEAARLDSPQAKIRKVFWVRRSNRMPTLYWWSLPLSLGAFAELFADEISSSKALVFPAEALSSCREALRPQEMSRQVALVEDVLALLRARDEGRVGLCGIALFPASRTRHDLERAAAALPDGLERQGFTFAILPAGDGGMRHRFAFRVPGQVLQALETLALERRFGGNLGQVEMAFLQGLALQPNHCARLALVLENGGASVQGVDRAGRRRVYYLESQKGYTGTWEDLTLRDAVGERLRESWRRFPVGVVMFAGLPFFIGAFWARHALSRGRRSRSTLGSGT